MSARQPRDQQRTCPVCGYSTPVTTRAMAESWLIRHSCAQQAERDRRKVAVAIRRASSGPVRDCAHPRAHHDHGTRAAYVLDRCRCRPCRDANSADKARVTRAKAYGTWDAYVPAEPVRAHVRALMAAGLGRKRISALAGVSQSSVTWLLYGRERADGTRRPPSAQVRPNTARRLLAVTADLDNIAARRPVCPVGTRRRIGALVAAGWSLTQIGDRLNMLPGNFAKVVHSDMDVHADTARRVRALYNELWDTTPPHATTAERTSVARSKALAEKYGWLPALAWNDDEIDDPGAWANLGDDTDPELDEVVVERLLVTPELWRDLGASKAERLAAASRLPSTHLKSLGLASRERVA